MILEVETTQGPGRMHVDGPLDARRVLVLGHGAGGGVEAPDLTALATHLPNQTEPITPEPITVVRFEQPWRTAGKKVAPAPKRLDEAWLEALPQLRSRLEDPVLVLGGRSAGARVACRTAGQLGAAGVLALAFPLHPPGKPDKSRADELLGVPVPTLVVQGSRDPFGGDQEVRAALGTASGFSLVPVADAGHELTLPKRAERTTESLWQELAQTIGDFIRGL
ncbi:MULTISPECIES: alpha/beta hydrolase family protein [unclassified Luteococcus]|uniref:alpha/beta hydrolase family protein n=1 Tax=unclassified Luteococcus TaxID=2639923 RepID=UPI00313CCD4F